MRAIVWKMANVLLTDFDLRLRELKHIIIQLVQLTAFLLHPNRIVCIFYNKAHL